MPLYEYACPAGHVTELRRPVSVSTQACSCGRPSVRKSVYRVQAAYPEQTFAGRDFIEASAEIEDRRASLEKYEGVPVKGPDLYKQALRKANRIMASQPKP